MASKVILKLFSRFVILHRDTSAPGEQQQTGFVELLEPLGIHGEKLLKQTSDCWKNLECLYNSTPVQPSYSIKCAEFCLFWVSRRLLEFDMSFSESVNAIFSSCVHENEVAVKHFMDKTGFVYSTYSP